jgi:hypothetical protein
VEADRIETAHTTAQPALPALVEPEQMRQDALPLELVIAKLEELEAAHRELQSMLLQIRAETVPSDIPKRRAQVEVFALELERDREAALARVFALSPPNVYGQFGVPDEVGAWPEHNSWYPGGAPLVYLLEAQGGPWWSPGGASLVAGSGPARGAFRSPFGDFVQFWGEWEVSRLKLNGPGRHYGVAVQENPNGEVAVLDSHPTGIRKVTPSEFAAGRPARLGHLPVSRSHCATS